MRSAQALLVTGGAGFIGSAFVRRVLALRPGLRLVTLDALTYAGSRDNLTDLVDPGRHTFVHGDVRDDALVRRLVREHAIDTVVHFAAESHVDRSIEGPFAFLSTNIEGTARLLEGVRVAWDEAPPDCAPRLHHVSTDEVYGDLAGDLPPSVEGDPYAPSSPYAASKAASDHMVWAWRRTYGLPATMSHGSNTYGPGQFPEKLLPVVIRRALQGAPIPLYGDGQQVRDWLYVDDHVDGVLAALERGTDGRTYHLGGGEEHANRALVERVCGLLDVLRPHAAPHARHITRVADRAGHDRRYALSTLRAQTELGWHPQVGLDEGLRRTVVAELARA